MPSRTHTQDVALDDSYSQDACSSRLHALFNAAFECEIAAVYTCGTGTIANAIALATMCQPHEAILCHPDAHINGAGEILLTFCSLFCHILLTFCSLFARMLPTLGRSECGAPEMMTGGAKLTPIGHLPGESDGHGCLSLDCIADNLGPPRSERAAIARAGGVHNPPVGALSITQPTENGTCYSLEEVRAIGDLCVRTAAICRCASDLRVFSDRLLVSTGGEGRTAPQ